MRLPLHIALVLLPALLMISACSQQEAPDVELENTGGYDTELSGLQPVSDSAWHPGDFPLIPATATAGRVADVVRNPLSDSLGVDEYVAEQIRLGFRIVRWTGHYARKYVGNRMACSNCHLNVGQRERAMPYVGIAAAFPQYRARSGRLISLEDRIRDCFERSINGTAPPYDSPELMAVAAYITWLSNDQPIGDTIPWRGKTAIAKENRIPIDELDPEHGKALYEKHCTECHGHDGQGVDIGITIPGPLWGDSSWNDGAGHARIYTLAGFIRNAMPLLNPGSLTDEQAQQIAAYINSHERPAYRWKDRDYPNGDVPIDAVYYKGGRQKAKGKRQKREEGG